MPVRVRLSEIVGGMDLSSDRVTAYLHRPTGRVVMITDDTAMAADRGDDAWVIPEELAEARNVEAHADEYVALPNQLAIDEHHMMERFAFALDDAPVREAVCGALHGAGTFRRFKSTVLRLGRAEAWYAYRSGAYADVAREWGEVNGIAFD